MPSFGTLGAGCVDKRQSAGLATAVVFYIVGVLINAHMPLCLAVCLSVCPSLVHSASRQYVTPAYAAKGPGNNVGIMFLCEAALGKEASITIDNSKLTKPPTVCTVLQVLCFWFRNAPYLWCKKVGMLYRSGGWSGVTNEVAKLPTCPLLIV